MNQDQKNQALVKMRAIFTPGILVVDRTMYPSIERPWDGEIEIGEIIAPSDRIGSWFEGPHYSNTEYDYCTSHDCVKVCYPLTGIRYSFLKDLIAVPRVRQGINQRERIERFLGWEALHNYDEHRKQEEIAFLNRPADPSPNAQPGEGDDARMRRLLARHGVLDLISEARYWTYVCLTDTLPPGRTRNDMNTLEYLEYISRLLVRIEHVVRIYPNKYQQATTGDDGVVYE